MFKLLSLLHHFDKVSQTIFFRNCILAPAKTQKSRIPRTTQQIYKDNFKFLRCSFLIALFLKNEIVKTLNLSNYAQKYRKKISRPENLKYKVFELRDVEFAILSDSFLGHPN